MATDSVVKQRAVQTIFTNGATNHCVEFHIAVVIDLPLLRLAMSAHSVGTQY